MTPEPAHPETSDAALPAGTIVAGRWRLDRVVAHGPDAGGWAVHEAEDVAAARRVLVVETAGATPADWPRTETAVLPAAIDIPATTAGRIAVFPSLRTPIPADHGPGLSSREQRARAILAQLGVLHANLGGGPWLRFAAPGTVELDGDDPQGRIRIVPVPVAADRIDAAREADCRAVARSIASGLFGHPADADAQAVVSSLPPDLAALWRALDAASPEALRAALPSPGTLPRVLGVDSPSGRVVPPVVPDAQQGGASFSQRRDNLRQAFRRELGLAIALPAVVGLVAIYLRVPAPDDDAGWQSHDEPGMWEPAGIVDPMGTPFPEGEAGGIEGFGEEPGSGDGSALVPNDPDTP